MCTVAPVYLIVISLRKVFGYMRKEHEEEVDGTP